MFRVESQLELLTAANGRFAEPFTIKLRGYNEDDVAAPAQFKDIKPIAVSNVVSFCPTYRGLVLIKNERVKDEDRSTWPRVAGRLIEGVLAHAFEQHAAATTAAPLSDSVDEIAKTAHARVSEYTTRTREAKKFASLDKMITDPGHFSNESLQRLLIDAITLDLFYQQGALNYKRRPDAPNERAVNGLVMGQTWDPPEYIKLSKAAPDFHVLKHKAIGDIKSGDWKDEYYLTAAGYALAYEATYKSDIDLGAIYLVDIDPVIFGQSRIVVFPITDAVRRRFLDRRNLALAHLANTGSLPPRVAKKADIAQYCDKCGLKKECFKRDGADV